MRTEFLPRGLCARSTGKGEEDGLIRRIELSAAASMSFSFFNSSSWVQDGLVWLLGTCEADLFAKNLTL